MWTLERPHFAHSQQPLVHDPRPRLPRHLPFRSRKPRDSPLRLNSRQRRHAHHASPTQHPSSFEGAQVKQRVRQRHSILQFRYPTAIGNPQRRQTERVRVGPNLLRESRPCGRQDLSSRVGGLERDGRPPETPRVRPQTDLVRCRKSRLFGPYFEQGY